MEALQRTLIPGVPYRNRLRKMQTRDQCRKSGQNSTGDDRKADFRTKWPVAGIFHTNCLSINEKALPLHWNRHGDFAEGLTTLLSPKLDSSPIESRCLGGFYSLFSISGCAEIEYWTYSFLDFWNPTTRRICLYRIMMILENDFWFLSFCFLGLEDSLTAFDSISDS